MDALLFAKEMAFQVDNDIGTTDYAPVWNRRARVDSMGRMIGHWDGFGQNLLGMVTASMLADGVRPADFQMNQAKTLTYYFANLSAPAYPLAVDQSLVPRGKIVFEARCAECHGSAGVRLNTVVSIDEIKTDPNRLDAARPLLLWTLNLFDFFQRYPASRWRKTNGYRAELLDGVWARAPYLHNGSVPTVYDLLSRAEQRPRTFYRGSNVIDPLKLGIATIARPGGPAFLFDTSLSGNRNIGHEYGADLPEADKKALIDFLKTL
jgi:processive rubber oxygenase RoxA-like protein